MPFIAEPQTTPIIIDASFDELNCIFSPYSDSTLVSNKSTPFILNLNTFEDDTDDIESPCGLTTFNESLDGSSEFYISLNDPSISDTTSPLRILHQCVTIWNCQKNCQYQKQ